MCMTQNVILLTYCTWLGLPSLIGWGLGPHSLVDPGLGTSSLVPRCFACRFTGEVSPREGEGQRQDEQLRQQRVRREAEVEAHHSVRHRILQEVIYSLLALDNSLSFHYLRVCKEEIPKIRDYCGWVGPGLALNCFSGK